MAVKENVPCPSLSTSTAEELKTSVASATGCLDPFSQQYRKRLCDRALAFESWSSIAVIDEREHSAPLLVKTKKQSATRCERKTATVRASTAPSRLGDKFHYLGHGRFGAVFELGDGRALKVEAKRGALCRLPWEALVLDLFWQRRRAMPRREACSVGDLPRPLALYLWRDAHALAMPKYGASLADALRAERPGQPTALFLALGILESLATLHSAGILHCDIKPDNFVLRYPTRPASRPDDDPRRLAADGFGLVLVDLGRAVDLRAHEPTTRFASRKTHVDEYEWPPAKHGRTAWRYQIDAYATGVLLFALACARLPPQTPHRRAACLPRGWNSTFWLNTVDALLAATPAALEDHVQPAEAALQDALRPRHSLRDDLLQLARTTAHAAKV